MTRHFDAGFGFSCHWSGNCQGKIESSAGTAGRPQRRLTAPRVSNCFAMRIAVSNRTTYLLISVLLAAGMRIPASAQSQRDNYFNVELDGAASVPSSYSVELIDMNQIGRASCRERV